MPLLRVIAAVANLASQIVAIWLYKGPYAVEISILVGTAVGLPIKYALEKQYIFEFTASDLAQDSRL